jgi:hypothetical protein
MTDRARTKEKLPRNLTVGGAAGRQTDDLKFLGREPAERIGALPMILPASPP